jgi:hypothetical protein
LGGATFPQLSVTDPQVFVNEMLYVPLCDIGGENVIVKVFSILPPTEQPALEMAEIV